MSLPFKTQDYGGSGDGSVEQVTFTSTIAKSDPVTTFRRLKTTYQQILSTDAVSQSLPDPNENAPVSCQALIDAGANAVLADDDGEGRHTLPVSGSKIYSYLREEYYNYDEIDDFIQNLIIDIQGKISVQRLGPSGISPTEVIKTNTTSNLLVTEESLLNWAGGQLLQGGVPYRIVQPKLYITDTTQTTEITAVDAQSQPIVEFIKARVNSSKDGGFDGTDDRRLTTNLAIHNHLVANYQPIGNYLTSVPNGTDATKIADGSVSNTEFQYLNGVTSPIQTQIDNIAAGSDPITDLYNLVPNNTNSTAIITQIQNHFKPAWWLDYTDSYSNGPGHGRGGSAFSGGVLVPNGKVILVPSSSSLIGIYDPTNNTYTNRPAHGRGTDAFSGGVLAPNGKVIFVPRRSSNIGIYDPTANTYTDGPPHNQGNVAYGGGVLAQTGKVILVPNDADHIGIYDPINNSFSEGAQHNQGNSVFAGGVLAPNGKIIFVPRVSGRIGIYDPTLNTFTPGPLHSQNYNTFLGGVLAPNGKIILIPFGSSRVGIFDPNTEIFTPGALHGKGAYGFIGGVLAPNGKIIFVPYKSNTVGIYDPIGDNFSEGAQHGGGNDAFYSGVVTLNGRIVLVPHQSSVVGIYGGGALVYQNDVLSPYFNKL